MNATLKMDAATLAADAAWLAKGAPRRTHVPVLATAHVSVSDAGLQLRMTDYDTFREVTVPAEGAIADDVAVLVDPGKLAAFLKGSKGDALVSVDASGVEIVIGARTVKVGRADGDLADYPQWPDFVPGDAPAAVLEPAQIKSVLVSVGKDDTLPMLTGVRFDGGDIASTDRFRLTRVNYAADGFLALVPSSALRLFTVGKGAVAVEIDDTKRLSAGDPHAQRHVRISRENRSVITREMDCEFPKWRQLIPSIDNVTLVAEFRRADLLAALAGDSVDLEFQTGGTVTVSGRQLGDVVTSQTIAADIVSTDGLPFTIRVTTAYLTAALKAIPGDVVEFLATTPTRPMVFQSGADTHLVMPQRIPA